MAATILQSLKYIPATVARKALEKVNPGFKNYFSSALAYGVDANRALDFLTDQFESEHKKELKERLKRGASANILRPDEMAVKSQLENQALPGKALRGAAAIGAGALAGGIPAAASQAISPSQILPEQGSQDQPRQLGHNPRPQLEDFRYAPQGKGTPETINMGPEQGSHGLYKGEHQPGLGQVKAQHQPGLGQVKGEHGPQAQSSREKSLRRHEKMNKEKKMIDKLIETFEKEYGSDDASTYGFPGLSGKKSVLVEALNQANQILGR